MRQIIIPSIIAETQKDLNDRINHVKDFFSWMQLDVMDGKFVKSRSIDFDFDLPETDCKYEVQLMIEDPAEWIEKHFDKVDTIIFHWESLKNENMAANIIHLIKSKGKRVGIGIKPATELQNIYPFLDDVDLILIMTVEPGYYGKDLILSTLEKVRVLRDRNPNINIEVDGGINEKTVLEAKNAGANYFVLGSYFQKSDDVSDSLEKIKLLIKKEVNNGS